MLPEEIICAPFTIWTAPVGTAFPDIESEPSVAWTKIGSRGARSYSDDGVIAQHTHRNETTLPAGNQAPSHSFTGSEEYRIRVQLLDMTLEQYAHALGGSPVATTAQGAGIAGKRVIGLNINPRLNKRFSIMVRGPSAYNQELNAQFEIPVAKETGGGPQLVFRRGAPVGISLEFIALENPEAPSADQLFGRLVMQTHPPA